MAKKQDKSSKTAHVLNLLTSPAEKQAVAQKASSDNLPEEPALDTESAEASEAAEAAEVNQQAAQVRQPLIPPILQVANHHDEKLAEQIHDALFEELETELGDAEPPTPPVTAPHQPAAAASGAVPPAVQPAPASAPEAGQFKLPASAIVSSFTIPEPPPLPPLQEELQFVNVMQKLVETMAPRYIEKFGLCSCPRCLEDVKALALTNLGPKYTVFPASERIPMLTVYERRYASLVATELTKACTIVKDNPRHS